MYTDCTQCLSKMLVSGNDIILAICNLDYIDYFCKT